jgi:hypothetical protein
MLVVLPLRTGVSRLWNSRVSFQYRTLTTSKFPLPNSPIPTFPAFPILFTQNPVLPIPFNKCPKCNRLTVATSPRRNAASVVGRSNSAPGTHRPASLDPPVFSPPRLAAGFTQTRTCRARTQFRSASITRHPFVPTRAKPVCYSASGNVQPHFCYASIGTPQPTHYKPDIRPSQPLRKLKSLFLITMQPSENPPILTLVL